MARGLDFTYLVNVRLMRRWPDQSPASHKRHMHATLVQTATIKQKVMASLAEPEARDNVRLLDCAILSTLPIVFNQS